MDEKPVVQTDVEIDVGALLTSLLRRLPYIIVLVGIVAVGTYVLLARTAPVYKAEATVLIDPGEADPTRPTQAGQQAAVAPDQQAIASEIQLILSREIAEGVAKELALDSRPEFDRTLAPPSMLDTILAKIGLGATISGSADDRVLKAYYSKLDVYAVAGSRVIGIDFSSTDPKLAADAANAIADGYLALQRSAKRDTNSTAADFLAGQIDDLRGKVVDAENKVEAFRSQNDLFTGSGQSAATLPAQQLADLNTELTKAHTDRTNAEAEANQIRIALASGTPISVPEVVSSPLIQGLIQQQVALKSQIAQLSATLLPQHPRMKELAAQVADLDKQVAAETSKVVDSLQASAQLAAAREDAITKNVAALKTAATKAGAAGVQLAELDREASAQRDLLDQYLRSYREAVAQADYLPPDARVVSRASVPLEPDFPKKLPLTAAVAAAVTILAIAILLLAELASGRPMRRVALAEAMPIARRPMAAIERDDRDAIEAEPMPLRHIAPSEPTLAPMLAGRVEQSIQAVASDMLAKQAKRIIVTRSQAGADNRRLPAALTLARELAAGDGRVVLVDFCDDGANASAVGEGGGRPGLADVFDGTASFSDVLFRDARSRVHFVPPGTRTLAPAELADERIEAILSALTLTYDQVVLDAREEVVGRIAPTASAAMVVSAYPADDSRTERAFARIRTVSSAEIHLLVIDGPGNDGVERGVGVAVNA